MTTRTNGKTRTVDAAPAWFTAYTDKLDARLDAQDARLDALEARMTAPKAKAKVVAEQDEPKFVMLTREIKQAARKAAGIGAGVFLSDITTAQRKAFMAECVKRGVRPNHRKFIQWGWVKE